MGNPGVQSEPQSGPSQQNDGGKEDPNRRKSNARKRTKTGCLTCRKRRIKCDESRPVCSNCIKSKRHCEGYNQRVVFKEPNMGSLQGPFNPAFFPPGSRPIDDDSLATQPGKQPLRVPLQPIAPRPPAFHFPQHHGLTFQQENVPYQGHFHQAQPPDNPSAYGLNPSQFLPAAYSQLPNPLLVSDITPCPAQYNPGSDLQYFGPEDDNAGEGPSNSNRLNNAVSLNAQPSNLSRPVDNEWEYDVPDDDASMPDSDDDLPDARGIVAPVANMLSRAWGRNATEVRTFSAFAQSSAVLAYMDAPHSSEFWNSGLSTIFMHFINVTGPSISLYERHPFDPAEQERFGADSKSGHSLWSYTFPVLALRHPGLLHAMLALASLQLAKLQDSPATAALKHYHRSIRRIAKNVRSQLRRTQPATLAATLLLGYFEVWSSDHTKWCNHLFGARILFREIPLREMTRICLPVKRIRQREKDAKRNSQLSSYFPGLSAPSTGPDADTTILDYEFLSAITGFNVVPEDYGDREGQILDERCFSTTDNDIEKYDTLCDLFWWYCKMDVYQSILGGTQLFMEYECWTQCPPRASASKFGAIYGTYDHLILLLGRLANFTSKDLSRKRKAAKSQGGNMGAGSPPMFPGMLPTHGTVHVPMGFSPPRDTTPQSDSNEDLDPHASYDAALQEWNDLHQAFEIFKKHLGNEFKPLSTEYADRRESPFGFAVQFRTFSIAGIWMNYYMGLIHLHRSHPSMPPAAMRAAGLTAQKTRAYAIQIGRIAAGLSVDCSQFTEINTYLGAAFIESSFCLFVAAVQYQDAAQRHWIVQRMHDIARLTGWQSARQIADGCESAWIKAEQLGGPPYVRPGNINNVPLSIWQNPRRIDRRIHELDQGEERRLVLAKAERAHYALGLLGVEEDLEFLELRDDPT